MPVSRSEFITELTPCLELVAPVGMDEDTRFTWFSAAHKALDGIPIALLERGCRAALAKADHPSKIVPTIMAEVGEDWDWRKRHAARQRPQPSPAPALTQQQISAEERAEVGKLMKGLVKKLEAGTAGQTA